MVCRSLVSRHYACPRESQDWGIDIIQAGDQAFAIQNFPVIVIDDRDYITTLHGQVEENPVSLSVLAFSNPVNTVVDAMPICA